MKLQELNEMVGNEFDTANEAFDYTDNKRDPQDYIILKNKKTGKYRAHGHMAWSQWTDKKQNEFQIINTRAEK